MGDRETELNFLRGIRTERLARAGNATALIYADCLEEQDQPLLAELIRVQCGIDLYADTPEGIAERLKLQRREAELLRPFEGENFPADSVAGLWQAKLGELFGDNVALGTYARQINYYAQQVFPLFSGGLPVASAKKLTPEVGDLPFSAVLFRITNLDGPNGYLPSNKDLPQYVANRTSLIVDIAFPAIAIDMAVYIKPYLERLEELKVYGSTRSLESFARVATPYNRCIMPDGSIKTYEKEIIPLPNLEKLSLIGEPLLRGMGYYPNEISRAINEANLSGLKYLKLENTYLRGMDLPDIAAASCMKGVQVLDLSNNQLGYHNGFIERGGELPVAPYNNGFSEFVGTPAHPLSSNLAALKFLELKGNEMGGDHRGSYTVNILEGITHPAEILAQLNGLGLADNNFNEGDIVRLKEALAGITHVDFSRPGRSGRLEDSRILGLKERPR